MLAVLSASVAVKHRKTKKPVPPPPASHRLGWEAMGWVVLMMLIYAVFFQFRSTSAHAAAIERRLQRWKVKYVLTDAELARLRELEEAFHGSGGLLPSVPPTPEENARHRREIAALLPKDAAQRSAKSQKPDEPADLADAHE
ncbi:MAG: hypothetical protein JSR82_05985 [Verrucomicrobia bacterium]|nr:hypothetical protein [Verrucomicrobiota bacterium]